MQQFLFKKKTRINGIAEDSFDDCDDVDDFDDDDDDDGDEVHRQLYLTNGQI